MSIITKQRIVAPLIELLPDAPGANTGFVIVGVNEPAGLEEAMTAGCVAVWLAGCEVSPDAAALVDVFFLG